MQSICKVKAKITELRYFYPPLDTENAIRYDVSPEVTKIAFAPTLAVSISLLMGIWASNCDPANT
jgi:hypothetical protein